MQINRKNAKAQQEIICVGLITNRGGWRAEKKQNAASIKSDRRLFAKSQLQLKI